MQVQEIQKLLSWPQALYVTSLLSVKPDISIPNYNLIIVEYKTRLDKDYSITKIFIKLENAKISQLTYKYHACDKIID